jgi:methionine-rich copper-binding protein CopC
MVHPWMIGTIFVGDGTMPTPEPEDHMDLEISAEKRVYDINTIAVLNISIEDNTKSQNVAIDITDPSGTTVISRSVSLDPDDSISFEFKIDENAKTGNYKVTATTSDGNRTEKDTTHFKVKSQFNSFKISSVEITDQKGNPSDLEAGEIGFIKVNMDSNKSIATLVTVNIFDSELTSIGIGSVQTTLSSGESEMILSFNIPSDAALGPADIYVNAFSDWPSEGGIPLTGEVSAVEDIQ